MKPLQDESKVRPTRTNAADQPLLNLKGIKVLFVDDAPDNRELVCRMLGLAEAEVELACTGVEGVEKGMRGNYNVILMDIQMPEMDGYEATTRLRNMGFKNPILAVTAHTRRENLEQCLKVGCDDFVCKPINRTLLIQKIKEHMHHYKMACKTAAQA
ncbi:MAG TPA: response regulator [Oligoflexus sp.]|uniref:response regulator n=1 Tax=Oligoflexus sp. TaxID=1971216 RepID=UPI002D6D019C|nr:response regulator [Oligoflexus sp.]HYX35227.1 response regulator [Oligoflexus sp.]